VTIAPDGPFELPDCDPAALRQAAHGLAGLGDALSEQASSLQGAVDGMTHWSGVAADVWQKLGTQEHGDLVKAAGAMHDAASTLSVLAGKLEAAQSAYSQHMTASDDAVRSAMAQRAAAASSGGKPPDTSDLDARAQREQKAADMAAADARTAATAAAAEFDRIAGQAPAPPFVGPPATPAEADSQNRLSPAILATLLGTVRVDADGNPVELDLTDPQSVQGAPKDDVVAAARAAGWEELPAKRGGGGLRFFKPGTNRSEGIRIMDGDPNAPPGVKNDPYAIITRGGAKERVPLEGNRELGAYGGPGTYASAKPAPEPPPAAESPGTGPEPEPGVPAEPEPVEPVEPAPVEPVEPIEPIDPLDLIP
jgi:hypothetical protein